MELKVRQDCPTASRIWELRLPNGIVVEATGASVIAILPGATSFVLEFEHSTASPVSS